MSCAPGSRMLPGGRLRARLRRMNGSYQTIDAIVAPGHAYGNHDGNLVDEGPDANAQSVDLFVVDSANRGVDPGLVPLRNQVIFEQDGKCAGGGSTELELCALRRAAGVLDFSGYRYVIKLTAKYKLDGLALPPGFDIVAQSQHRNGSQEQNSEFVAIKASRFSEFIQRLSYEIEGHNLENRLWKLVHAGDVRFTRLPPQHNHARYKRGIGDYLQHL